MPVKFRTKSKSDDRDPFEFIASVMESRLLRLESASGVRLKRGSDGRVALPLKCGAYGCVFELESDTSRIMKITSDPYEGPYTAYVKMLQDQDVQMPCGSVRSVTVRVDGVWKVYDNKKTGDMVYAILEERVNASKSNFSEKLSFGADQYTTGWDTIDKARKGRVKSEKTIAKARQDILEGVETIAATKHGRPIAEFLKMVYEDGLPLTDMHTGNLCRRIAGTRAGEEAGQVVIIDFGVSRAKSPFRNLIHRVR